MGTCPMVQEEAMQQALQITFRGMEVSPALEARVHELAQRLERFDPNMTSCHVIVEQASRHQQQGGLYEVHIRIGTPGGEVFVSRAAPQDQAHEDPYVAVRDAFDAAARKLEDHVRTHDHRKRVHETPSHGVVRRLFPQDGYGFVETSDGLEVYFHENAVLDRGFDKLSVGDEVRIEIAGKESSKGPQATAVRKIGKHHLAG